MNKNMTGASDFSVGKSKRRMTVHNIADAMLTLMADHIGRSNALSKGEVFKHLFKKKFEDESLSDYLRWDFTKRAMHLLRQQTKCFVVSERREDNWFYFVAKDDIDAQIYVNVLDNNIKRMKSMQKRASQAVEEKWYAESWSLPRKSPKKLASSN